MEKLLVNPKNMKNKNAGFTLVEVLTVIMIIAILASVVLVSLDRARERTRDSTIKNQMSQLRSLAETTYSFSDGYENFDGLTEITTVQTKIDEMGGKLHGPHFSGDYIHYCAYADLVTGDDEVFCVDSLGNAERGDEGQFNCTDNTNEPFNCLGDEAEPECQTNDDCGVGEKCDEDGNCVPE